MLGGMGIHTVYSHQARAMDLILQGQNVLVATPTASGKSLIYNLPVLNSLLRKPEARALYLFPLKALAQDQVRTLENMAALLPEYFQQRGHNAGGDLRRRHLGPFPQKNQGAPARHSGQQPGHAPPLPASLPSPVGQPLCQPDPCDHRRGAHLPRRLRLAHGLGHPAAETDLPSVRREPGVHPLLGHRGQSRRTRNQSAGRGGHRHYRLGLAPAAQRGHPPQSPGFSALYRDHAPGGCGAPGAAHHRLYPVAEDDRTDHHVDGAAHE